MSYAEDMGIDAYDEDTMYNRGYWVSKYGKRMKINEMAIGYIRNCVKYLETALKAGNCDEEYVKYKIEEFNSEINRRKTIYGKK